MNATKFFRTLFDIGELTCFSADPYGTMLMYAYNGDTTGKQFFSINPMNGSRKDAHVTAYRNLLFEIDDADWAIDRQLEFIRQKEVPITSAVFSGGKSVHFIISLAEPCKSISEYKALWRRIRIGLDSKPDKSTSNPSRFSRTPGAIRVGTTTEQRLLHLGARVSLEQVEGWLSAQQVPIVEQVVEEVRAKMPAGMKGILTGWTERFIAMGAAHGEWNVQLFKSSCDAFRNNYTIDEWCDLLCKFHVHLDEQDLKTIRSAERAVSEQE